VAYAAGALGLDALVYMPREVALPKLAATRNYGADVRLVGFALDEAMAAARQEAARTGRVLIHPYDHVDVVAGQGTVGLEILQQVPDVRTILVPLGGGGLAAGIAVACAAADHPVRVVGVQAAQAAAYPPSLAAGAPHHHDLGPTMADGIAVGTPGDVPFEILRRGQVEVRTVGEEALSQAMVTLAERAKLVAEPAGVAGVAALMADPTAFEGPVVPVISGGNIDPLLLARVIQHGMVAGGRYLHLEVLLDDHPGSLARLLQNVAGAGGNITHVEHSRTDLTLDLFSVSVSLQMEAKGPEHCLEIVERLKAEGFDVVRN
jgi:threonine dehydratase